MSSVIKNKTPYEIKSDLDLDSDDFEDGSITTDEDQNTGDGEENSSNDEMKLVDGSVITIAINNSSDNNQFFDIIHDDSENIYTKPQQSFVKSSIHVKILIFVTIICIIVFISVTSVVFSYSKRSGKNIYNSNCCSTIFGVFASILGIFVLSAMGLTYLTYNNTL